MPTPLGIFADMVAALAPAVGGSALLAGYLIGLGIVITILVVVVVAFADVEGISGAVLFIAGGFGVLIVVLVGLWDSWTVIFIGILLAWLLKDSMFSNAGV